MSEPGDFRIVTENDQRVLVACPHHPGWRVRLTIEDYDEAGVLERTTSFRLSDADWNRLRQAIDR